MRELRLLLVMLRATVVVSIRRLVRGAVLPAWRLRMEAISHALKGEARKAMLLPVDKVRARMPPSRIPRRIAKQVVLEPGVWLPGFVGALQRNPARNPLSVKQRREVYLLIRGHVLADVNVFYLLILV